MTKMLLATWPNESYTLFSPVFKPLAGRKIWAPRRRSQVPWSLSQVSCWRSPGTRLPVLWTEERISLAESTARRQSRPGRVWMAQAGNTSHPMAPTPCPSGTKGTGDYVAASQSRSVRCPSQDGAKGLRFGAFGVPPLPAKPNIGARSRPRCKPSGPAEPGRSAPAGEPDGATYPMKARNAHFRCFGMCCRVSKKELRQCLGKSPRVVP